MPRPPDWEAKPIAPGSGWSAEKVAFMDTAGSVLMTPKQLGPTSRIPLAWASRTISRWAAAPSAPASAKPAEMTTRPADSLAAARGDDLGARAGAGTATTARSTSPGTSSIGRPAGNARPPSGAAGFTG